MDELLNELREFLAGYLKDSATEIFTCDVQTLDSYARGLAVSLYALGREIEGDHILKKYLIVRLGLNA